MSSPIHDVYDSFETELDFEEFEAKVEQKKKEMGNLVDVESAALLIKDELQEGQEEEPTEIAEIADLSLDESTVTFVGKVKSIGDINTFENSDSGGRVCNVDLADETDQVRVTLWNKKVEETTAFDEGDGVRVTGSPKDGYTGLEVDVSEIEPTDQTDINITPDDVQTIADLSPALSDSSVTGVVVETGDPHTFERNDGSEGKVANATLGDSTGQIQVTFWGGKTGLLADLEEGETVTLTHLRPQTNDGDLELHATGDTAVEAPERSVEFRPPTESIEDVEIGDTATIEGAVIDLDDKHTFDRDDGSTGQVRNATIRGQTGELRVALWGEKADREIDLADELVIVDAEIQEGWQGSKEASVGWQSTLTVRETSDSTPSSENMEATGLGDYQESDPQSEDSDPPEASEESESADSPDDGVEFTGTVMNASDEVLLRNDEQKMIVQTDETVHLGEEITVRGTKTDDGTIDADDVF